MYKNLTTQEFAFLTNTVLEGRYFMPAAFLGLYK